MNITKTKYYKKAERKLKKIIIIFKRSSSVKLEYTLMHLSIRRAPQSIQLAVSENHQC